MQPVTLVQNDDDKTVVLDESRALDSIRRYIQSPPENSRVFTVTTDMATTLLREYNHNNRPHKPQSITKYAANMSAGTWALTGDTLKFSDAGLLRDGQNRLMACVRSRAAFRTHVVFGIEDKAFDVFDRGRNRDGSDVLSIAGFSYTNALAAAVRWVYLIDSGRAHTRESLEPTTTLSLLQDKYPDLPDFVHRGRSVYEICGQPVSMVTAALYLFHKTNPKLADEFSTAWESGKWGGKFHPINLMQQETKRLQTASPGRVHEVVRMSLMIKAWNLCVARKRGRKGDLLWDRSEPFPEIAR
jgi:hypothetical protein